VAATLKFIDYNVAMTFILIIIIIIIDAAVTVDGSLFQALVAATRNARSPSDDLLVASTTSAGKLDDLRRCLGSIRVTC